MLILKCPKVCTKKNTMERSHICIQIAIFKIKYSKIIDDDYEFYVWNSSMIQCLEIH